MVFNIIKLLICFPPVLICCSSFRLLKTASLKMNKALSFDRQKWFDRFNLLKKIKNFCQQCACSFYFWFAVAAFTFAEPVLCSYYPTSKIFMAQIAVLSVSTLLYFVQLIGVATREWDKIIMIEAMSSLSTMSISHNVRNFTAWKMFVFFTAEGEYIMEFCCLAGGWCTIFFRPGIAVLRCFRVFRLLWFYEVEVFKSSVEYTLSPILGKQSVSNMFNVLKFAIRALTALGSEMFRLTKETRGALLLIMVMFYSAFVLGAALWIETGANYENCTSLGSCTFTLLRLTFFDGNGFDFAYYLTSHNRIMFCLVMLYMCITAFGIINGLVGIFGTAFAIASHEAFSDNDDEDDSYIKPLLADNNEDDNDDDQDDESNNDDNDNVWTKEENEKRNEGSESPVGEEGVFAAVPRRNAVQAMTADGSQPHQSAASRENELAVKRKLMEGLGGKSNFAMRELAKLSEAPVKQETTAAVKPRSLRNFVKKALSTGNGSHIVPDNNQLPSSASNKYNDDDNNSVESGVVKVTNGGDLGLLESGNMYNNNNNNSNYTPSKELISQQGRVKPKINMNSIAALQAMNSNNTPDKQPPPRQFHAAAGMFATMKKQKSSKFTNDNNGSSSGNNIINNGDMKILSANMLTLQRKVEAQSDMIVALFTQIQLLTAQLQIIHPELQPLSHTAAAASAKNGSYNISKNSSNSSSRYQLFPTMRRSINFADNTMNLGVIAGNNNSGAGALAVADAIVTINNSDNNSSTPVVAAISGRSNQLPLPWNNACNVNSNNNLNNLSPRSTSSKINSKNSASSSPLPTTISIDNIATSSSTTAPSSTSAAAAVGGFKALLQKTTSSAIPTPTTSNIDYSTSNNNNNYTTTALTADGDIVSGGGIFSGALSMIKQNVLLGPGSSSGQDYDASGGGGNREYDDDKKSFTETVVGTKGGGPSSSKYSSTATDSSSGSSSSKGYSNNYYDNIYNVNISSTATTIAASKSTVAVDTKDSYEEYNEGDNIGSRRVGMNIIPIIDNNNNSSSSGGSSSNADDKTNNDSNDNKDIDNKENAAITTPASSNAEMLASTTARSEPSPQSQELVQHQQQQQQQPKQHEIMIIEYDDDAAAASDDEGVFDEASLFVTEL